MTSEVMEVNLFTQIRLTLEKKFGNDPIVYCEQFSLQNHFLLLIILRSVHFKT